MDEIENENNELLSEVDRLNILLQDSRNDGKLVKEEVMQLKEICEKQSDEIETLDQLAKQYKNSWKMARSEIRHLKHELDQVKST